MKFIAFADTHLDTEDQVMAITKRIVNERPDAVVCAGDWCHFGKRRVDDLWAFQGLIDIGIPFLFVEGNHESDANVRELEKLGGVYLGGSGTVVGKTGFFGLPFSWNPQLPAMVLRGFEEDCLLIKNQCDKLVLLTHMPPFGYRRPWLDFPREDDSITGKWIREIMVRVQPDLVITGHLHCGSKPHERVVGGCRIVNPGFAGWMGTI